jgi:hypothetical protein
MMILMISCSLQKEFPRTYFLGHWKMRGFESKACNGLPIEKMVGTYDGDKVIATKTLGDKCVTTGHETFSGVLPKEGLLKSDIELFKVKFVVGSPSKPNSGKLKNSIIIIDENNFKSKKYNLSFFRDTEENAKEGINPFPEPEPEPQPDPEPQPEPEPEPQPEPEPEPQPEPEPEPEPEPKPVVDPVPEPKPVVDPVPEPKLPPNTNVSIKRLMYFSQNYFVGKWYGFGYKCDDETPKIERIDIKNSEGKIFATKINGDNCVHSGSLSFSGVLSKKLYVNHQMKVSFAIGSPKKPSFTEKEKKLTIIDLYTFKIENHTFYRVMGEGYLHSNVHINMTPIFGHGRYEGAGYINLNPKRTLRHPVRRFVIVEEEVNSPGNC